jgi:acid phosphatase (class A)
MPTTSVFSPLACCITMGLLASVTNTLHAQTPPTTDPSKVPEVRAGSGYLVGYLSRKDYPNSLALLPPPPVAGSAAQAADDEAHQRAKALREGGRGQVATSDAVLKFPAAASTFSCALGTTISQEATPNLNMLLRRSLTDAGLSTYAAKDHYQRTRPFVTFKEASCTPAEEAGLAKDGSYPSGHSAIGWAWGLILAEVAPDRAQALLERGHAFGQSRSFCGVHWQSDVEAGRLMAAATVARLHANADFVAQLQAARAEVEAAKTKGTAPERDCALEAAGLNAGKPAAK